mmetsp:Transcript_9356/g.18732  ORF Transcript_9356/g.18732 Transcript_9356/m.18732 type:complete len:95 (+) Transcript_9356:1337-1621(+)
MLCARRALASLLDVELDRTVAICVASSSLSLFSDEMTPTAGLSVAVVSCSGASRAPSLRPVRLEVRLALGKLAKKLLWACEEESELLPNTPERD